MKHLQVAVAVALVGAAFVCLAAFFLWVEACVMFVNFLNGH